MWSRKRSIRVVRRMKAIEIKKDIFWVGAIDWDLRDFHGYLTQKGSTYNAYLIVDKKIVLIDTVRSYLSEEMISRIKSVIDPSKIDIVVSNHSEMDHSGALPDIMKICKNATLICSPNGESGLKKHFDIKNWKIKIVKTDETINIGKKTLSFVLMQMVHWPDSMATYLKEEKILFPNDAFGQHLASHERFVDEYDFDTAFEEAKKYYANIFMPFSRQTKQALDNIHKLDFDMIAPSHGLVWRKNIKTIIDAYESWYANETKKKAVIVYDTMWGSTKLMAYAIYKAFEEKKYLVQLKNLKVNNISDIMTDIIDAKYICIGSPTLNNTVLPTVASFLFYLKGLRPKNRVGLSFGSYGWGGQGTKEIEELFHFLEFETLPTIKFQYIPKLLDLENITQSLINQLE